MTRTEPYTRDLLRLAAEVPGRVGFEALPNATIHRSPTCGSRLASRVTIVDGRIASVEQALEACAFGQAAAHLVAAHAPGMTVEEARDRAARMAAWLDGATDDAPWPGVEALDGARALPGRRGAILLPFVALRAALDTHPVRPE